MTRLPSPAQHARRLLNQVAMQHLHRRCEAIRMLPEEQPASPPPQSGDNVALQSEAIATERPIYGNPT